jgi:hypothetical protein
MAKPKIGRAKSSVPWLVWFFYAPCIPKGTPLRLVPRQVCPSTDLAILTFFPAQRSPQEHYFLGHKHRKYFGKKLFLKYQMKYFFVISKAHTQILSDAGLRHRKSFDSYSQKL